MLVDELKKNLEGVPDEAEIYWTTEHTRHHVRHTIRARWFVGCFWEHADLLRFSRRNQIRGGAENVNT